MLLQPDQIDRIISAVGDRYRGNLHRDALHGELEGLLYVWEFLSSADSDRQAREKHELFAAIAQHGSKLGEALTQRDCWPAYYLHGTTKAAEATAEFEAADAEAQRFMASLQRVISAAENAKEKFKDGAVIRMDRPPNDWLAGEKLPMVFERHFPQRAGVSRPSDLKEGKKTAGGPFIRFAVAVFREIGINISPDTVARAFNDVRNKRTRRKLRSPRTTQR